MTQERDSASRTGPGPGGTDAPGARGADRTLPSSGTGPSGTGTGGPDRTRRIGPPRDDGSPSRRGGGVAAARQRAVSWLVTLISIVTTVVVLILAVHIVFVAFEANTGNALVHRIGIWADDLAWQFKDVFQPKNPKVGVAVNYGLAAVVYLVIGRIVVAVVRRVR
ncbi:hypothetical protein DZF91_26685 [Actinomadura logoneensis]|uniref:Uncharacterized protein n=1 Tax=Actinomadura logoneensis TaxID=2293572 RepID=A0A372JFP4_9ACTN|nr:hypothetical protein [Actinomadura logoneensis]RFU38626.1 hypothetical protein DZF91_26685 [Actinomadura logoneensis]